MEEYRHENIKGRNHLASFSIREIATPLKLSEQEQFANTLVSKILDREDKVYESNKLPKHLEDIRKILGYLDNNNDETKNNHQNLPIFSQLSPRTKRKISVLPRPNDYELDQIRKIERETKSVDPKEAYVPLIEAGDEEIKELVKSDTLMIPSEKLIPNLVPKFVNVSELANHSTSQLYEEAQKYKQKKALQAQKLAMLFDNANADSSSVNRSVSSQSRSLKGDDTSLNSSSIGSLRRSAPNSPESGRRESQQSKSLLSLTVGHSNVLPPVSVTKSARKKAAGRPYVNFKDIGMASISLSTIKDAGLRQPTRTTSKDTFKHQEYLNEFSAKVYDEMGLNLNAEYNRIRKHRSLLQSLLLHWYFCRLRSCIERWKIVMGLLRKKELKTAGFRLLRVLRARILWRRTQEQIFFQLQQKQEQERRDIRNKMFRDNKASIITRSIRLYGKMKVIRLRLLRRRSATQIQRLFRGFVGRKTTGKIKVARRLLHHSARVIQCLYRMRLSRRKVIVKRKLLFVQKWFEEMEFTKQLYRDEFWQSGAESYIARLYRTYVIKKKLRKIIYWHRFALAIVIQKTFRGYRVRSKYQKRRRDHQNKEKLELKSAIIIQKYVRRFIAEEFVANLFEEKEDALEEKYQRKVKAIEAGLNVTEKIKFWFVKLARKLTPFRYGILNNRAIKIQRIWRGHHGRQRAMFVRVHSHLDKFYAVMRFKYKHATIIQKRWRGYQARSRIRALKQRNLIVTIQCGVRVFLARGRLKRMRLRDKTAKLLAFFIRRLIIRRRFHKKYMRDKFLEPFAVKVQTYYRKGVARKRFYRHMVLQRFNADEMLRIMTRMTHLLSEIQLRIFVDTMNKAISQRYPSVSKRDCVCFGPMQALFVLGIAGGKTRTELRVIGTNKVETQSLLKYMNRVGGLMISPGANTAKVPPNGIYDTVTNDAKEKRYGDRSRTEIALMTRLFNGDLPLPTITKRVNMTQVDLAFKKSKRQDNPTQKLSYKEFLSFLELIGSMHYKAATATTAAADEDTALLIPATTGAADANDNANDASDELQEDNTEENDAVLLEREEEVQAEKDQEPFNLQSFILEEQRKVDSAQRKNAAIERLTLSPSEVLAGESVDYRLVLALRFIVTNRKEGFVQELLSWLELESKAQLGLFVTRAQALYRGVRGRRYAIKYKAFRLEELRQQQIAQYITKAQSYARKFICRMKVMKLAQLTIVKYVPHLGESYYFNPKTQLRSRTKPKILGHLDAFSIAVPEEGLDNVVKCYNCQVKNATLWCEQCEDSMCKVCYDSMHCKGARSAHTFCKIPICSYCKYQMASKSCVSCIAIKPKAGTRRALMVPSDRGVYCDSCFVHEHDHFEQQLEKDAVMRGNVKRLMSISRQAYIVKGYMLRRPQTTHQYKTITQQCEECMEYSASWRCYDCNQVYCNRCLISLHSINPHFISHHAEQLPYYTPRMHQSLMRDVAMQKFNVKFGKLKVIAKKQRLDFEFRMIVKIQSWWRMILYRRDGFKYMQRRRRKLRSDHRYRKREDREIRSKVSYYVNNLFGYAPYLHSDTREETVLKRFSVFKRQRAREFIWKNMADWGYFRVSNNDPRKGVPKRGFDVGEIEELVEQAKFGGVRLPGRIMLVSMENEFETTCDLREILHPGELVLIKNRIFGVLSLEENSIKLSRLWREESDKEEGELMYRLPTYKGEPLRWLYKRRYLSYQYTIENPLSQLSLRVYKAYCLRMIRFCLYMFRSNKKNKMRQQAQEWKDASRRYADNIRWANSLLALTSEDKLTDLSRTPRPAWYDDFYLAPSVKAQHRIERGEGEEGEGDEEDFDEVDGSPGKKLSGSLRRKPSSRRLRNDESKVFSDMDGVGFEDRNDDEDEYEDEADEEEETGKKKDKDLRASRRSAKESANNRKRPLSKKADGHIHVKVAEKKLTKKATKTVDIKAGTPWYATAEQNLARKLREEKMDPADLALEAGDWKEMVDPMTENIYWLHIYTNEMLTTKPRSILAKEQLEFQNSKNKKAFDDAQKRIARLEKETHNRLLINGQARTKY